MRNRLFNLYLVFIGAICFYVISRYTFGSATLTLRNSLVQGVLIGAGLAVVTVALLGKLKSKKVNGWTTVFGCGLPGNDMFTRAAHAWTFPGPVNVPQEAMYWWTHIDSAGHMLDGRHNYIIHFPAGGLPPNNAFWSLTMADSQNRFVANPINRYAVGDRSGLFPNNDGSVDIYLQKTAPVNQASATNWLPTPAGNFNVWLRVYMPGTTILDGKYELPPIVEDKLK